jgi:CO/xanthine dehydrogenase Mo-binding subunit
MSWSADAGAAASEGVAEVVDPGLGVLVIDPDLVRAQVEGGLIWALGAAA